MVAARRVFRAEILCLVRRDILVVREDFFVRQDIFQAAGLSFYAVRLSFSGGRIVRRLFTNASLLSSPRRRQKSKHKSVASSRSASVERVLLSQIWYHRHYCTFTGCTWKPWWSAQLHLNVKSAQPSNVDTPARQAAAQYHIRTAITITW